MADMKIACQAGQAVFPHVDGAVGWDTLSPLRGCCASWTCGTSTVTMRRWGLWPRFSEGWLCGHVLAYRRFHCICGFEKDSVDTL